MFIWSEKKIVAIGRLQTLIGENFRLSQKYLNTITRLVHVIPYDLS